MISKRLLVVFLVMFSASLILLLVASTFVYDAPLRDEIKQFVVMPDDYIRTVDYKPWWKPGSYAPRTVINYVWVKDCWVYQVSGGYYRAARFEPRFLSPETVQLSIQIFPHPSSATTPISTDDCPLRASLTQVDHFGAPDEYARRISVADEPDAIELAQLLTKIGDVQSTTSYRIPRFEGKLRPGDNGGGVNTYKIEDSRFNVTVSSDIGILYILP